jgi:hypothetical protein
MIIMMMIIIMICKAKHGKAITVQGWSGPEVSRRLRLPEFLHSRHMEVVRSALRTARLYPQVNIPGTHFCYRLSRPQCHSAAGRIMSMKNCNDTIGNRTYDLPVCSAVSQPTASPGAPGMIPVLASNSRINGTGTEVSFLPEQWICAES